MTQHRALGRLRQILLGESGARGLAAAERRGSTSAGPAVDGSADDLVDPVPDEPGFHELDIDPDVAAADESAIDAMAALFVGPDAEPVVAIPAPRRPTPYKRTWRRRVRATYSSPNGAGPGSPGPAPARADPPRRMGPRSGNGAEE